MHWLKSVLQKFKILIFKNQNRKNFTRPFGKNNWVYYKYVVFNLFYENGHIENKNILKLSFFFNYNALIG